MEQIEQAFVDQSLVTEAVAKRMGLKADGFAQKMQQNSNEIRPILQELVEKYGNKSES